MKFRVGPHTITISTVLLPAGELGRWDPEGNRIFLSSRMRPGSLVWKETVCHEMMHAYCDLYAFKLDHLRLTCLAHVCAKALAAATPLE